MEVLKCLVNQGRFKHQYLLIIQKLRCAQDVRGSTTYLGQGDAALSRNDPLALAIILATPIGDWFGFIHTSKSHRRLITRRRLAAASPFRGAFQPSPKNHIIILELSIILWR